MKKTIILFFLAVIFISELSMAQRKTTGLDIKFGIQPPVFNFDDLYNTGYGFYFGGLFPFSKEMQFTLYTGYLTWGFDNEALIRKFTNEYYTDFNIEAPMNLVPLTIGIKYYASKTKVKPYFSADFGFFYYWQTVNGTYTWKDPAGGESTYVLSDQTESGFRTMLSLGAGIVTPLSEIIDLDLQIKLNALYNAQAISGTGGSGEINGSSSTLYYMAFMIGINYYLEK